MSYVGRFAPSPTGPLHLGSLVAALGSLLDARSNNGSWLLRMEDLDPPRQSEEAKSLIPRQLAEHGLYWDGDILFQSHRLEVYQAYLTRLHAQGALYQCDCSRKRIHELGGVYDGRCRELGIDSDSDTALRVRAELPVEWQDLIQGRQTYTPSQLGGDYIVRRRDGLFSYQLAVALDDSIEDITRVIRGADLLDSTARQLNVQQRLSLTAPEYGHLPVVCNSEGIKLSKQSHAQPLENTRASANLVAALNILGQSPDSQLEQAHPEEILGWAVAAWRLDTVPQKMHIRCGEPC